MAFPRNGCIVRTTYYLKGEYLQPLAVRLGCRHRVCMRAYSVDLRRKIVEALWRGLSKAEAARAFGVGISSVKRYVTMARKGESLAPKKASGKERKLDQGATRLLDEDLHRHPEATYEQRTRLLFELLGLRVSEATLCGTVKRLGYTRKKDQWPRANGTSGRGRPGGLWLLGQSIRTGSRSWTRWARTPRSVRSTPTHREDEGPTRKCRAIAGRTRRYWRA